MNQKQNKPYKVTIQEVITTYMIIDAESPQEARREAINRFNNGDSGFDEDDRAYVQKCETID